MISLTNYWWKVLVPYLYYAQQICYYQIYYGQPKLQEPVSVASPPLLHLVLLISINFTAPMILISLFPQLDQISFLHAAISLFPVTARRNIIKVGSIWGALSFFLFTWTLGRNIQHYQFTAIYMIQDTNFKYFGKNFIIEID